MAAKITAFLTTLLLNIASGIVILFMMLVAMNGFSGSDAEWGLCAYILLAVLASILMSVGAALLVHIFLKRQFSAVVSALIAIPVFTIVGIVIEVVCSLIGIGIAEYVRVNY